MTKLFKHFFSIILLVCIASCNGKIAIDNLPFDLDSSETYFRFKVNGELIILDNKTSSSHGIGHGRIFPSDSLDSVVIIHRVGRTQYKNSIEAKNSIQITFFERFHHSLLDLNEPTPDSIFRQIFRTGEKRFVLDDTYDKVHEPGVKIILTDMDGNSWASAKNVYEITGNEFIINNNRYFNITHSIKQPPDPVLTIDNHKIRAVFNCVLYNANGDSLEMTDAEFVSIFNNRNE